MWTSSRVCAGRRRTLRSTIVTIFSHMTRDVSVFIARQHTDAILIQQIVIPSVRPSVCPSRSGIRLKRLNIIVIIFSPYKSSITLSITSIKHVHEIPTASPPTPCGGAKYRGYKNFAIFRQYVAISCRQYTQDIYYSVNSYCGRRIGTRMRSIDKWYVLLPVTLNQGLQSRIFFSQSRTHARRRPD